MREQATVAGRSILLVDDDAHHLEAMRRLFDRRGWEVRRAPDGWSAVREYARSVPEVVLLDLDLPDLPGLRVLELLRERDPDASVIVLTGHSDVASAVDAMRHGAENFLTKPVDIAHLEAAVDRAREKAELRRRSRRLGPHDDGPGSLGASPVMRAIDDQLTTLADGMAPVLLGGETGTGKTRAAQLLHVRSPRRAGPFIEVNCAGLSAAFLDSELFGHERGAFTDAKTQKSGLFELAHGGTMFLDEIGDLDIALQPKLLRVLETQRFRRLGGTREIQVDVRVVAATHRRLEQLVEAGRFREDLFYRLSVFPIALPPLRERSSDDLLLIVRDALAEIRQRMTRVPERVSGGAIDAILRHPWPGNVRELRNVLERAALLSRGAEEIGPQHLPADIGMTASGSLPTAALDEADLSLAAAEQRHIERVLAHFGNHRTRAARALGISRATLYAKLALTAEARAVAEPVRNPDNVRNPDDEDLEA